MDQKLEFSERLQAAMAAQNADMAMAAAPEADGAVRPQPVFCLLKTELLESLVKFTQSGGRKIDAWTAQHRCAIVPFDQSGDSANAFANPNEVAMEAVLPEYLWRYRPSGQYAAIKGSAKNLKKV